MHTNFERLIFAYIYIHVGQSVPGFLSVHFALGELNHLQFLRGSLAGLPLPLNIGMLRYLSKPSFWVCLQRYFQKRLAFELVD